MTTLSRKTALVTGASRGRGRASALALTKSGFHFEKRRAAQSGAPEDTQ